MESERTASHRPESRNHLPAVDGFRIESRGQDRGRFAGAGRFPLTNIWIICRKELKSYFSSPIAYLLMAIFAVIFGFFFYSATAFFVMRGMEAQMMGRGMPMDVNEWVIRPLLSNASVIGLFLIPMITMRLYAEEKRTGTFELLATSPVRDLEIIIGKWLAALIMYASILALSLVDLSMLFAFGKP